MKACNSAHRDRSLYSRFLLALTLAVIWGGPPAAAADPASHLPVRPLLRHTLPTSGTGASTLPAGLHLVDWRQIRAEYERHRHGMFADKPGGFQSRSHYHGWLARFDGKGFTVKPDREEWRWGLELERWGRSGEEVAASLVERMESKVNRLEYRRQGITEWFENGPEGLEHGFTIPARPTGARGELSLQLRQRGELVAEPDAGGRGVTYKTAQGHPALRYRKLVVTDATGRKLSARMVAEGSSLQILVDDRRAAYPIIVDPIAQQAYLKASNTGAGDYFGNLGSVGIDGNTVVVGAPLEDSNATGVNGAQSNDSATDSGAAYIFVRSGSTWLQQAYLKASRTVQGDRFGVSVAISGDTVVVGTFGGDSNAPGGNGTASDNTASTEGGACVFVRSGTTWSQQAYLKGGTNKTVWSYTGGFEHFGLSVAISGNTAVIGANGDPVSTDGTNGTPTGNSVANAGAAYVFVRNGETWGQEAYLKASNPGENDNFGYAVAISENTVVVGANREDSGATGVNGTESDNSAFDSGAAYVFVRSGTSWNQQAYLKASNPGPLHRFGYLGAVAISADTLVVGAFGETSNATGVNGNQSDNSTFAAGAAYVFVRSGTTWSQQAYLKASNTRVSLQFGVAVGISGNAVVVGANGEQSNVTGVNGPQDNNTLYAAGAAYLFLRTGTTWRQEAYIKASNTGEADDFASAVAISGDTVIVGAAGEDSSATGVNGNGNDNNAMNSGAAYVFVDGPSVTGINPSFGPLEGGQSVTITGTNFTGATAVTIGGATALNFTVVNATTITATTPAGSAGPASVVVTTANGTNDANTLYTYAPTSQVSLTFQTNPPGRAYSVNGLPYTTAQTLSFPAGAAVSLAAVTPQQLSPGTRNVFASWSQGGPAMQSLTVPTANTTYTVQYNTEHQLTTAVSPAGSGSLLGGNYYLAGSTAGITPLANPGYAFLNYSGDLSGTTVPGSVVMNSPKSVTANFAGIPSLTMGRTAATGLPAARVWTITVTNSATVAAANANIGSFTLTQTAGETCTSPPVISPLPAPPNLGPIAAGGSAALPVTINFSTCPAAARFTLTVNLSATGYSVNRSILNLFR